MHIAWEENANTIAYYTSNKYNITSLLGICNNYKNDQHCSRAYPVGIKHLFNGIAFAIQPPIVIQWPYIRWSLRKYPSV
eukprot:10301532-Heterocapsa_arctica.AAC.1